MKTLIVVNSHKGNTRQVADAIADELGRRGPCLVVDVDAAGTNIEADVELVLVGGPTEGHGMTPEMRGYLDGLAATALRGKAAAAFDTRLAWPRILSGSAADGIAHKLGELDAHVIRPQGSFIVSAAPELQPGELERARQWASSIAERAVPVPA